MVKMGSVWDRSAEFLTDNLPAVMPIALLAFFVPLSIQGSFTPLYDDASFGLSLALRLISLGFGALAVWGSLVLTAMVLDGGNEPGRVALARLLPALAVTVATFLAIGLLFAPAALALVVSGVDFAAVARGVPPEIPGVIAAPLLIYVILMIGVAFWLSSRLVLVNAMIVDRRQMFGAIPGSWRLTRGLAWRIIGVMLLYVIVSMVAALAAQMVFGSIFGLIAGSGTGGLSLSSVLTSVTVAAVQTGFTVLVPVFTAKLYLAVTAQNAVPS